MRPRSSVLKIKTQRDSLCSDMSSSLSGSSHTHSVCFDTVEVREYPMMLDEARYKNPFLTIDWEPCERRVSTFEEYEGFRSHEEANIVDPKERLYICLRSGIPSSHIREHLAKPNPYLTDSEIPAEGESCRGLLGKKEKQSGNKNIFSKMKRGLGKRLNMN
ncbi:hypothetical protein SEMRO_277_G106260.1 [Seminavis robusta]|uniref:Uncharacterized protein n=1 Tax=Seminavis robusta TaxID=568900 RepID=A0A9N8HBY1_9STRA|nr:hypothetical protein SEMRO_277_G106260.1 [Seminavis robusta]|eukprot:Sro277_g106260.1 n/a (161) ;mRNA; f:32140-32622